MSGIERDAAQSGNTELDYDPTSFIDAEGRVYVDGEERPRCLTYGCGRTTAALVFMPSAKKNLPYCTTCARGMESKYGYKAVWRP